jgi:hypothetical protein
VREGGADPIVAEQAHLLFEVVLGAVGGVVVDHADVVDARPVGVRDERRPRLAHVGEPVVRDVEQFDAHEPIRLIARRHATT